MPGLLTAVVLALATPTATAAPRLPGNAAAGVSLERIRPRMRRYLGVPAGVLVVETTAGSPAEQAGLRSGDVVVQANAGRVFSPGQVSLLVSLHRGDTLPLLVYREGLLFVSDLQVPKRERPKASATQTGAAHKRPGRVAVAAPSSTTEP